MFKVVGNFLNRTPWWALFLGGIVIIVLLGVFTVPFRVMKLAESGSTPAENRAIKREIDNAFGDSALGVAESIVSAMKETAKDPARREELDRAQEEITRARQEIFNAQREAREAAREAAKEAAQAAYEAAKEARQSVEAARKEAIASLKERNVKDPEVLKSFDESLKSARDAEAAARAALDRARRQKSVSVGTGIGTNKKPVDVTIGEDDKPAGISIDIDTDSVKKQITVPLPPAAPSAGQPPKPATPTPTPESIKRDIAKGFADGFAGKRDREGIVIDHGDGGKTVINLNGVNVTPGMSTLPPQLKEDIRASVARDVRRIGLGTALILAFIPLFIVAVIAKYFIDRSRRAQAFAEVKKQEADVSNMSRQVTEARLQALQAQVEPHFLYNTLANVQALTEVDPAAANQMTGHLIQYLRSSLPKMRENTSTIGQEIELVRAYLNILKMRMGARLEFGIDVPVELNGVAFPPLMLPSLVENAIKHGLEPVREGGRIDVAVSREGDFIRVAVKDTGRGLTDTPTQAGGGVGLSNIRERLIALYGEQGKLTLESNEPKGVIASIVVPTTPPATTFASTNNPSGLAQTARSAAPIQPSSLAGRTWVAVSKTHSVWTRVMSITFLSLMVIIAVMFGLGIAGIYTGTLPIHLGSTRFEGMEGMALGTVALVIGFGLMTLVALLIVVILYGLGVLFAGLAIFIPIVILISVFPVMAPFFLFALAVYWFWRRQKRKQSAQSAAN
jgi:signal transduction histidine kinase